jgi:hypothetical protein
MVLTHSLKYDKEKGKMMLDIQMFSFQSTENIFIDEKRLTKELGIDSTFIVMREDFFEIRL